MSVAKNHGIYNSTASILTIDKKCIIIVSDQKAEAFMKETKKLSKQEKDSINYFLKTDTLKF